MKLKGISYAILAAVLYALNSPCSKLLLKHIPSTLLAGILYLGAGLGLLIIGVMTKRKKKHTEKQLTKSDLPYIIGMVILDIIAPICLLYGLNRTTAANAALLNNFEIVATSLIALWIFKESISKRLWLAIGLVTTASILLSVDDISSLNFSYGSFFVLLACLCWGLENNCTRKLSDKDPLQIVVIKGFCSGIGSILIALAIGESISFHWAILLALLLGFAAYGLSIYFYIYAQRFLGAAKTSTYYAFAPFIGSGLSLIIFREQPTMMFGIAVIFMFVGALIASTD